MSTIGNVERKIRRIEHFEVRFLYLDGTDVRSDKEQLPQYPFEIAASGDITVEAWKQGRFRQAYPGYEVKVLDARRTPVQGNTRLSTVRDTYQT
ncbi:MAG: hypothetical protein OEU36_04390 [Gammaproteobacteria bacterium]|nr:hypothetical protein [Gammaproteobacteria bacterium]